MCRRRRRCPPLSRFSPPSRARPSFKVRCGSTDSCRMLGLGLGFGSSATPFPAFASFSSQREPKFNNSGRRYSGNDTKRPPEGFPKNSFPLPLPFPLLLPWGEWGEGPSTPLLPTRLPTFLWPVGIRPVASHCVLEGKAAAEEEEEARDPLFPLSLASLLLPPRPLPLRFPRRRRTRRRRLSHATLSPLLQRPRLHPHLLLLRWGVLDARWWRCFPPLLLLLKISHW